MSLLKADMYKLVNICTVGPFLHKQHFVYFRFRLATQSRRLIKQNSRVSNNLDPLETLRFSIGSKLFAYGTTLGINGDRKCSFSLLHEVLHYFRPALNT